MWRQAEKGMINLFCYQFRCDSCFVSDSGTKVIRIGGCFKTTSGCLLHHQKVKKMQSACQHCISAASLHNGQSPVYPVLLPCLVG
jgi:hypothetical protein